MQKKIIHLLTAFLSCVVFAHTGWASSSLPFNFNFKKEAGILTRPEAPNTLSSDRYPILVHYSQASSDDYARSVLNYLETAWEREFITMGFRVPLADHGEGGDDRFDLYISPDLDPGVGGYTGFSGFENETPLADAYGYIVIATNLNPKLIRGVIAHELFHASQMAYDWWESLSFAEGSSVWIVQHIFPDEDIFWRYYKFFNAEPHRSLDFVSLKSPYQYGTGIFYQFLDEHFGQGKFGLAAGQFIKLIWEQTGQNTFENEPNFLQTINKLLGGRNFNFEALRFAWSEFAVWRLLVGKLSDGRHLAGSEKWENSEPVVDQTVQLSDTAVEGVSQKPNEPLSHAYIAVDLPENCSSNLRVRASGAEGFQYSWRLISYRQKSVKIGDLVQSIDDHQIEINQQVDSADRTFLIVSVLPFDGYDPASSDKKSSLFRFEFQLTE